MRVLVIGDSCTDVFVYGNIERICPEAPVPVFNPIRRVESGGMAKNVKSNLEALGLETRPPFPEGYHVDEMNFELLETVKKRGKIWRDA